MDETHPGAAALVTAGQWFLSAIVENDASKGRWLGLSGSTGCGKTKVARAIYNFAGTWGVDLILKNHLPHWTTMWIDWPAIAEADDEDDFKNIEIEMDKMPFIVIDDIGSEADRFKNGVATSRLRRILSGIDRKWVIVTSNMTMETLCHCYDARVADRFRAFQWVEVGEVPSYRPKLRK